MKRALVSGQEGPSTSRLLLEFWISAVAVLAVFGSGFLEEHLLAFEVAKSFMAIIAAHVLVRAREREGGPFIVVESRGLPPCAIVAIGAGRDVSLGELAAMGVGMARLALEGHLCGTGVNKLRSYGVRRVGM